MTQTTSYSFGVTLGIPYEEAIERVTVALKEQGFGVLTTIDVQATLKEKIAVDFEPYIILGACNPHLAYQGLQAAHELGLLLPCNVIVHAHGPETRIDIVDPLTMLSIITHPELGPIAQEARQKLLAVLDALKG